MPTDGFQSISGQSSATSSSNDSDLSVNLSLWSEAQLKELQRLGQLLLTMQQRSNSDVFVTETVTSQVVTCTQRLVDCHVHYHDLLLDELYQKFARVEDLLRDRAVAPLHNVQATPVPSSSSDVKRSTRKRQASEHSTPQKSAKRSAETHRQDSFDWIKDEQVRATAKLLADSPVPFDPNADPRLLLSQYVFRIFDCRILCYGFLVA
jgi:hypothetical protein